MTNNAAYIDDDGLAIFNSTTGLFDGVELTTKGDILTRNTTNYIRQAIGTDTHALVCDSTEATGLNYAAKSAGSNVIFLSSQTASSSAQIDFTTPFDDATYLYYIFTYTNVVPSTDNSELRVRMSVNAGSSYLSSNYRWVRLRLSASAGSDSLSDDHSSSKIKIAVDLGNAAGEGLSGKAIYIPSASPGSSNPGTFIHDNSFVKGDGKFYRNMGSGLNTTSSVVDGLRFYMDSGNIASGIFKMYGVTKS